MNSEFLGKKKKLFQVKNTCESFVKNLENHEIINKNKKNEESNNTNNFNKKEVVSDQIFNDSLLLYKKYKDCKIEEISVSLAKYVCYLFDNKQFSSNINIQSLIENYFGFNKFLEEKNDIRLYFLVLLIFINENRDKKANPQHFIKYLLFDGMNKLMDKKIVDIYKDYIISHNINLTQFGTQLKAFNNHYNSLLENLRKKTKINVDLEKDENNMLKLFSFDNLIRMSFIYFNIYYEKELDFTEFRFKDDNIIPLLLVLKFNNSMTTLDISDNKLNKNSFFYVGQIINYNNKLKKLSLQQTNLDLDGLEYLINGIVYNFQNEENIIDNYNISLEELIISNNLLRENSGKSLGLLIKICKSLKYLEISNNIIKNEGIKEMLEMYYSELKQANNYYPSLEQLVMNNINLNADTSLYKLGDCLINENCKLNLISLSSNPLECKKNEEQKLKFIEHFFDCISKNNTLKELFLLNCKIDETITPYIIKMLEKNKSLTFLTLYNNNVTDKDEILKFLNLFCSKENNMPPQNEILKDLDLSKNNFKFEINDEFLDKLDKLKLNSLDISQNKLSMEYPSKFKEKISEISSRLKIIY